MLRPGPHGDPPGVCSAEPWPSSGARAPMPRDMASRRTFEGSSILRTWGSRVRPPQPICPIVAGGSSGKGACRLSACPPHGLFGRALWSRSSRSVLPASSVPGSKPQPSPPGSSRGFRSGLRSGRRTSRGPQGRSGSQSSILIPFSAWAWSIHRARGRPVGCGRGRNAW